MVAGIDQFNFADNRINFLIKSGGIINIRQRYQKGVFINHIFELLIKHLPLFIGFKKSNAGFFVMGHSDSCTIIGTMLKMTNHNIMMGVLKDKITQKQFD